MKNAQRVIKYLAIAFGLFLSISIIGAIISVLLGLCGVFVFWNGNTYDFTQSYSNIRELDIDIGGIDLTIEEGEEFKVEAQGIPESYKIKQENDVLKIEKTGFVFWGNGVGKITIYIPKDTNLRKASIETGEGQMKIENLEATELELKLGAGEVKIDRIVTQKADIDCGVGQVVIKQGDLTNLDLNAGVGRVEYNGFIRGNSDIDCGVGETVFNLSGTMSMYNIVAEKGIGSIVFNGKDVSSGTIIQTGDNKIDIDGGVGRIEININEQ